MATGSDLQGGGLFSFIKAKGTPTNRAIIGSVFVALGVVIGNPQLVTVSPTLTSHLPPPLTPTLTVTRIPTLIVTRTPTLPDPDPPSAHPHLTLT